jgi:hypothetical protein
LPTPIEEAALDPANRYFSRFTYYVLRAEYFFGATVATFLLIRAGIKGDNVDWVGAVVLFAYPDTIGYLPGAIAYRRSKNGRVPLWYARTYNVLHSMFTAAAVAAIYVLVHGADWALLAIPIHLFGDRSVFGNIFKMEAVRFEPEKPHPAFARVEDDLERPWWEFEDAPGPAEVEAAPAERPAPVGAR